MSEEIKMLVILSVVSVIAKKASRTSQGKALIMIVVIRRNMSLKKC